MNKNQKQREQRRRRQDSFIAFDVCVALYNLTV